MKYSIHWRKVNLISETETAKTDSQNTSEGELVESFCFLTEFILLFLSNKEGGSDIMPDENVLLAERNLPRVETKIIINISLFGGQLSFLLYFHWSCSSISCIRAHFHVNNLLRLGKKSFFLRSRFSYVFATQIICITCWNLPHLITF